MKADERGCELCDPIEVVLSSEKLIRLSGNKTEHLHNQREITDLQTTKADIFRIEEENFLDRGTELRLYATFFHIWAAMICFGRNN